jgi:hypothetical protein
MLSHSVATGGEDLYWQHIYAEIPPSQLSQPAVASILTRLAEAPDEGARGEAPPRRTSAQTSGMANPCSHFERGNVRSLLSHYV